MGGPGSGPKQGGGKSIAEMNITRGGGFRDKGMAQKSADTTQKQTGKPTAVLTKGGQHFVASGKDMHRALAHHGFKRSKD